jgi:hypothetical protein
VSARVGSQATQVAPPAPQAESDFALQVDPEQQPLGHDVASHTHSPFTHRWPPPQGGAEPHPQAPTAEQLSARIELHPTQGAPPVPQLENASALHPALEQQPLGHEAASQTHAPVEQR